MNQAERDLIANLFQRIRGVETAPRDPEAEAFIDEQVVRQPHAPYAMAQTVVVQDHALKAAQDRIEALENEIRDLREAGAARFDQRPTASPWGPRAQDAMDRSGEGREFGRPEDDAPTYDAPRSTPGARPTYGGSGLAYGSPPPYAAGQSYGSPQPQPEPQRSGGGFMSGALQTAAGVAAGALLFQGVRSLFGGDEARAGEHEATRLAGGDVGGSAPDPSAQGASDAFQGWFGGGGSDEPDDGDAFDPDDGGDDRWI
ncbi:MAG: hypothetical protein DI565_09070 [Ancylobacter novellus]|uniref:DUF2076 domain-containing protein n=1 Tax=Ancylobacter novellus TaxID=921 RepID=A0A2W5KM18_ANCNO|nr:MAG: hypothetical protein DI565_09070 [Ancylobacter novellus]